MSKKLTVQQEITTMYFLDLCSDNFLKGNWNKTEKRRWFKARNFTFYNESSPRHKLKFVNLYIFAT